MDRSRFRYGLEQGPDGLPIEDFEIMPSLGVSFGIVTGPLRIPVIGCWASPNLTIFMLFERLGVVVISTHAYPFNRLELKIRIVREPVFLDIASFLAFHK